MGGALGVAASPLLGCRGFGFPVAWRRAAAREACRPGACVGGPRGRCRWLPVPWILPPP